MQRQKSKGSKTNKNTSRLRNNESNVIFTNNTSSILNANQMLINEMMAMNKLDEINMIM